VAKVRNFHQARWDEPVIFELSQPGERGILVPEAEKAIEERVGDGVSVLPEKMIRREPPGSARNLPGCVFSSIISAFPRPRWARTSM